DLTDQIAGVIHTIHVQAQNAQTINLMVDDFRQRERALQLQVQQILSERPEAPQPILENVDEERMEHLVEDSLRRLHDFSYLGEQPLAQLRVVAANVVKPKDSVVTFIDRG